MSNITQQEKPLDSLLEIITPENITIQYRLAGPFYRIFAYGIDLLIQCLAVMVIGSLTFLLGWLADWGGVAGLESAVAMVSLFLLLWFYGSFFEVYWNGQTPGKRMMKIRVISQDGTPIDALQAVLRNILRYIDVMPILSPSIDASYFFIPTFGLGFFVMLLNSRYQRLGDWACGTIVVIEEKQRTPELDDVSEVATQKIETLLPAKLTISRTLASSLTKYVARRNNFSPERRTEIANHVCKELIPKYNLPYDTDPDALLCLLYKRAFLSKEVESESIVGS